MRQESDHQQKPFQASYPVNEKSNYLDIDYYQPQPQQPSQVPKSQTANGGLLEILPSTFPGFLPQRK